MGKELTPEELAAEIVKARAGFRHAVAALKRLEADFKRYRPHAAKLLRCAADLREHYSALDRVVVNGDTRAIELHTDRVRLGWKQVHLELTALEDAVARDGSEKKAAIQRKGLATLEAMIAAFRAKSPGVFPSPQPPFARKRRLLDGKKD